MQLTATLSENYHKGIKSQILAFLSDSEARSTVSEMVSHVEGALQKMNAELSALGGKIEEVKWGVYRWSPDPSLIDEAYSFSSLRQSFERERYSWRARRVSLRIYTPVLRHSYEGSECFFCIGTATPRIPTAKRYCGFSGYPFDVCNVDTVNVGTHHGVKCVPRFIDGYRLLIVPSNPMNPSIISILLCGS